MRFIIAYDIRDDSLRALISRILQDEGGIRIQYSVFILECSSMKVSALIARLRKIMEGKGILLVIPLCKKDYRRCITLIEGNYNPFRNEVSYIL